MAIREVISRLRGALGGPRIVHVPDKPAPGEPRLFFLRGHPRSGTNWVGGLLNQHPRIRCVGEFHFEIFAEAMQRFASASHHQASNCRVRQAANAALESLIRNCVLTAASAELNTPDWGETRWVGDRTPREIWPLYPGAPWIQVARDGRDVAVSMTFHHISIDGPELQPHKDSMREDIEAFARDRNYFRKNPDRLFADERWTRSMARSWAGHMRLDRDALAKINAESPDTRVLRVRYERLHEDVEGERTRMYRFLDLDPSEAHPISSRGELAPGHDTERPGELRRKGATGDWANYFTDDAKRWFKEEAGDELIAMGYVQSNDW